MGDALTKFIVKAKLAEQAERYEEMASLMKSFVEQTDRALTPEERNLLSVAYKNVVGAKRASWRQIVGSSSKVKDDPKYDEILLEYQKTIEKEIIDTCQESLELVQACLKFEADTSADARVFFYKMKGDYLRYTAEVAPQLPDRQPIEESQQSYEQAMELAKELLPTTNAIRLGLALNYSVFYYEILKNSEMACQIAKTSFDEAISELDSLTEDSYKDSTLIMQLLRDNLTVTYSFNSKLWTQQDSTEEGENPVENS